MVGDERAVDLEQELITGKNYFKPLCDAGATPLGHNGTGASARRVMNKILNNNPIVLQIQEELSKPGATLEQTAAGSEISTNLDRVIRMHEAEMRKLREELQDAIEARDSTFQQELRDELAALKEDLNNATERKEKLKQSRYVPPFQIVHNLTKCSPKVRICMRG